MVFLSTTSILQLRMSNVKGLYTDFFHQVKKCFFTNAFSNSFHSNIMNSFFKKHKTDKMFINTISKLILLSLPCLFADLKYICPIHIFMFPIFFAMQPRVVFEKSVSKQLLLRRRLRTLWKIILDYVSGIGISCSYQLPVKQHKITQAFSKSCQTSKTQLFAKLVNGQDGFFCENSRQPFSKKFLLRCLTGF